MKQKLTELKGKTDNSTVIIGDIKIPNFILARTTRQINQETERFCIHEIFQARVLKWVDISFSRESSQPRNLTQVFCTAGKVFTD